MYIFDCSDSCKNSYKHIVVVVFVVVMTSRGLGFVSRSRDEPDDVMNENDNRKCEEEHYCKERREGEGRNAKTQNKNNPCCCIFYFTVR